MKNLKLISLSLFLFAVTLSSNLMAQSTVAHINSQELIETMESYKDAMAELDKIDKTYRTQIDEMLKEAQKTNERYQAEANTKTEEENQRRMQKLQEMQDNIMGFSEDAQEQLKKKQETMLRPILEKAREVIQKVAREKGYEYVLDSSTGTGVLLADGYNLMDDVRAEINK
ncbi:OmpH family outer membrane protein [Psychroflexus planctonicus]|uniref:Membrane protein n=1 Tax=Psychroflexus planctonicus TaxID=1526575 RepID=A0ABQ1SIN6_9FLAO|nr:OmpH family outer membrane protein [Psychroflexus planctonicus]GGE38779.1 membrane protein [Psychroflexus planctonicus]